MFGCSDSRPQRRPADHISSTIPCNRCACGCRYRVFVLILACPKIVANVAMSPWFFTRKRVAKLCRKV